MRTRILVTLGLVTALLLGACVQPEDNPTNVHDLRVLGMRLEPPEILMEGCDARLLVGSALAAPDGGLDGGSVALPPSFGALLFSYALRPLQFQALIADPTGQGRMLNYRLLACASRGDRQCDNEGDFVELQSGTTAAGELNATIVPGLQALGGGSIFDGGTPLLLEVIQQDTFKGLGGIRVPLVLEVSADDTGEKIYAQKLMVYTCQFFPSMKQNVTPVLPGIVFNKVGWPQDEVIEVHGRTDWALEPEDFSSLQEPYVVPSLALKPVDLTEAWKVTWLTTSGTMSPYNTGGVDPVGEEGRHRSTWKPDQKATEPTDVTFTFVVRDGRGGSSWMQRRVKWFPE